MRQPTDRRRLAVRLAVALAAALTLAACGGSSDPPAASEEQPPSAPVAAPPEPTSQEQDLRAGLLEGPYAPGDTTLYSSTYYPNSPTAPPAPDTGSTETDVLARVTQLVAARDPMLVPRAEAAFSDPDLVRVVPDAALRGGLASLVGTFAEPTIEWVARGGAIDRVEFDVLLGNDTAKSLNEDGEQVIVFDEDFRFEDPALLGAVLVHEALHSDGEVSDLEELVALALQSLVHMEQVLADPTVASERTELAQRMNPWVLARINTRADGAAALRLALADDAPTIFPGGIDRPYFAALFDPSSAPTPGNPLLAQLLASQSSAGFEVPTDPGFDVDTIEFLDGTQGVIDDDEVLTVATAFGLRLGGGI